MCLEAIALGIDPFEPDGRNNFVPVGTQLEFVIPWAVAVLCGFTFHFQQSVHIVAQGLDVFDVASVR